MIAGALEVKSTLNSLIKFSVLSANVGYTLFLFPVLGMLYPDKVPFTIVNILSFIVINSLAGLFLGVCIHFLLKALIKSVVKAAGISIVFLWLLYWIPAVNSLDMIVLCLDGVALFSPGGRLLCGSTEKKI